MLSRDRKFCCCYVSKNHLIVMLLSYLKNVPINNVGKFKKKEKIDININLKENNDIFNFSNLENITLIFENDFNEEINKISNTIKFPEKEKQYLMKNLKYNLNTDLNTDLNALKGLVIVQGSYEFIENVNNKLNNNVNVAIINCFEFQEFEHNISEILKEHSAIINTLGVRPISEIFNRQVN